MKKRREQLNNSHLRLVTAQDSTDEIEERLEEEPVDNQPESRCQDGVCSITWKPKRSEAA